MKIIYKENLKWFTRNNYTVTEKLLLYSFMQIKTLFELLFGIRRLSKIIMYLWFLALVTI